MVGGHLSVVSSNLCLPHAKTSSMALSLIFWTTTSLYLYVPMAFSLSWADMKIICTRLLDFG